MELVKEEDADWGKATYRNQKVSAFPITVYIPSLDNRQIRIAVCKNKKGQLAFIGTSRLDRNTQEIVKVYRVPTGTLLPENRPLIYS